MAGIGDKGSLHSQGITEGPHCPASGEPAHCASQDYGDGSDHDPADEHLQAPDIDRGLVGSHLGKEAPRLDMRQDECESGDEHGQHQDARGDGDLESDRARRPPNCASVTIIRSARFARPVHGAPSR